MLDRALPRIQLREDGSRTTYLVPGAVLAGRRAWAAPTGCWIGGPDGTYRVDVGTEVGRLVGDTPVVVGATVADRFLACGPSQWAVHAPDDTSIVPDAGPGAPVDAVGDGDTFVVLLERRDVGARRYQLIRIRLDGTFIAGPTLPWSEHRSLEPTLLANPLTIAQHDTFHDVAQNLTIQGSRPIPRPFLRAGTVGDHIWTVGHPPYATSRSWWPLDGPTPYDHSRGQFWLLTILDRSTLRVVHTAPLSTPQPSLTRDDAGAVWLAAAGTLARIDHLGGVLEWPEDVETDLLICRRWAGPPRIVAGRQQCGHSPINLGTSTCGRT